MSPKHLLRFLGESSLGWRHSRGTHEARLAELSVMPESLRVARTVLRRHGGRGIREERREEGKGEGECGRRGRGRRRKRRKGSTGRGRGDF